MHISGNKPSSVILSQTFLDTMLMFEVVLFLLN